MTSPDWIKNLKPGDRVVVTVGLSNVGDGQIARVLRKTRGGRVVIPLGAQTVTFNPDGQERGGWANVTAWRIAELTPPLEAAIADRAERARILHLLDSTRWRDLPLETLRAVAALLPEKEKK
ncbi:MAG TPA: hypothetical protein VLT87_10875 [Thermoanaerobaculia bacterium]|nr:hypothetical protein [Thermoanaerobaculia bacterium]